MKLDPTDISTITAFFGTTFLVLYLLRSGRLASLTIHTSLMLALVANWLFAGLSNTSISEFAARSAAAFAILKCTTWIVSRIETPTTGFTPAGRQVYATSTPTPLAQNNQDFEFEEVA